MWIDCEEKETNGDEDEESTGEERRIKSLRWKGKEKEGLPRREVRLVPDPAVLVGEALFLREPEENDKTVLPMMLPLALTLQRTVHKLRPQAKFQRRHHERQISLQLGQPLRSARFSPAVGRIRRRGFGAHKIRQSSYVTDDASALLPIEELTEDGMSALEVASQDSCEDTVAELSRPSSAEPDMPAEGGQWTLSSLSSATIGQATRVQVLSNRARQVMGIVDGASGRVTLTQRASITQVADLLPRLAMLPEQEADVVKNYEAVEALGVADEPVPLAAEAAVEDTTADTNEDDAAVFVRRDPSSAAQLLLRMPLAEHSATLDDEAAIARAMNKYSARQRLFASRPSHQAHPTPELSVRLEEILQQGSPVQSSDAFVEGTRALKHAALLVARHSPQVGFVPGTVNREDSAYFDDDEDEATVFRRWYQLVQLLSL